MRMAAQPKPIARRIRNNAFQVINAISSRESTFTTNTHYLSDIKATSEQPHTLGSFAWMADMPALTDDARIRMGKKTPPPAAHWVSSWIALCVVYLQSTSGLKYNAEGLLRGTKPFCGQLPPSLLQTVGRTGSVWFFCGSSCPSCRLSYCYTQRTLSLPSCSLTEPHRQPGCSSFSVFAFWFSACLYCDCFWIL